VITAKDETGAEKLGFEYLDGPVTPKPEKIPEAKRKRRSPRRKPPGPKGGGPSPRGSVPKVPLVKV
jgi:ATP-dependent Clp protease ATP-binding subunit ClpA